MFRNRVVSPSIQTKNVANPKHLILFFDINGTVMAADASREKDADAAILQLLAENYSSQWDKNTQEMTFRKYIDNVIHPGNPKDVELKSKRLEGYKSFMSFLETHEHPLHKTIEEKFHEIKNNLKDGNLFNSFINLIHYLNENNLPFTIIFRTFGHDLNKVIAETEERTQLKFGKTAAFKAGMLHVNENQVLSTPIEILKSVKPFEHSGWQDHWQHWNSQGEIYDAGKLYPIDFENENIVSIFFDDNALDKEILGVKSTSATETVNQGELQKELIRLGRIVPVNTFNAIVEGNYFIDKVNFALNTTLVLSQQKENSPTISEMKKGQSANFLFKPAAPSNDSTRHEETSSAKLN